MTRGGGTRARDRLETIMGAGKAVESDIPFFSTWDESTIGDEQQRKARALMDEAFDWIADNPDAWAFAVASLDDDAEHARRCSMQHVLELIRRMGFMDVYGKPTSVSHCLRAPLTRIYLMNRPGAYRFFRHRRALVDCIIL